MDESKKQSPLEMLVAFQQAKTFPTKATPKDRFEKTENDHIIIPLVEDYGSEIDSLDKNLVITNSNLVLNFNLNVDSVTLDRALEKSKQVAKSIAAGAAMLGTAFILGGSKKFPKVKIPLLPKVKVPKFKKEGKNEV